MLFRELRISYPRCKELNRLDKTPRLLFVEFTWFNDCKDNQIIMILVNGQNITFAREP